MAESDELSEDAILNVLKQYGDSVLQDSCEGKDVIRHKKSKRKVRTKTNSSLNVSKTVKVKTKKQRNNNLIHHEPEEIVDATMRKKQKWLQGVLCEDDVSSITKKKKAKRKAKKKSEPEGLKVALKKREPEIIVFVDPTRKEKKIAVDDSLLGTELDFDLLKARHEVRRLGIHGLEGDHKEKATMSLLTSLGAKMPKKKSKMNYKEYLTQLKTQTRLKKQSKNDEYRDPNEKKPTKTVSKAKEKMHKKQRKELLVSQPDGQIGRYRKGVQFLSKKDLAKIQSR